MQINKLSLSKIGKTVLIIPDSHDKPDVDPRRYDWLGKFIVDLRPDIVVDLGDFSDVASCSSYDKGKASFEGRRFAKDVESAVRARRLVTEPIQVVQQRQRAHKEKVYKPLLVALGGNHEHRITRLMNDVPELHGMYSEDISDAAANGWQWVPFGKSITLEGITFMHYFPGGIMGRPIGGEYPAATLIKKNYSSCVQGHNHLWDWAQRRTSIGHHIFGLTAGCYMENTQHEEYAGSVNHMWARGLTVLTNVENGFAHPHFIGVDELRLSYNV